MAQLLSLTGVSGAGKTTLVKELVARKGKREFFPVMSVTTRQPRSTDLPGEYEYVSIDEFNRLKGNGSFLWSVEHAGAMYGTKETSVMEAFFSPGKTGIMILVPEVIPTLVSFLTKRNLLQEYKRIFLVAPREVELYKRLYARGESRDFIEKRISLSREWDYNARYGVYNFHFVRTEDKSIRETADEIAFQATKT